MPSPTNRLSRRRLLIAGAGLAGTGLLAACSQAAAPVAPAAPAALAAPAAAPAAPAVQVAPAVASPAAAAADLNAMGWPKSIEKLAFGFIPQEDAVQQKNQVKAFTDFISGKIGGIPIESSITTSYAALVEAQRNRFVQIGYYGPLSFLLAEQQFGAIPIMVDSKDGKTPGAYQSLLLAGKDSPVKTVADIKGKDFSFVDPASTSGNLFPRVMLIEAGIDPNKDIKGRFAGNHANSILAIAKNQVPCGASNNLSVDAAVDKAQIARDDLVILKTSPDIPNGPFAVHPELDKRALKKLQEVMAEFKDPAALKAMELVGPLVPTETASYNFVREAAKTINVQFDENGVPKPIGEG
jgi:phosphonate transport system substrate-binding protein